MKNCYRSIYVTFYTFKYFIIVMKAKNLGFKAAAFLITRAID